MTIADLFLKIKHSCTTNEEYLCELLKFRGFLLENCEGGMRLSDNSHSDDKDFLLHYISAFGAINEKGTDIVEKKIFIIAVRIIAKAHATFTIFKQKSAKL